MPTTFCTTVKNRLTNLKRLADSIRRSFIKQTDVHLIVADYQSTDGNLAKTLGNYPFPVTILQLERAAFNRSQGLNLAAGVAPAGSRLFFVDVDMLLPPNMADLVQTNIRTGVCWFPICYSLHQGKPLVVNRNSQFPEKANGYWREAGKGMFGVMLDDFNKLGRWNEGIGTTYGREDGDIYRRACKAEWLKVIRERCLGLYHVWHPLTTKYRTGCHARAGFCCSKDPDFVPPAPKVTMIAIPPHVR